LVTTRILNRRRFEVKPPGATANAYRRRVRPILTRIARSATLRRLSPQSRVYVLGAVVFGLIAGNLVLSAQATQLSYDLARLHDQQAQLTAEQGQLAYQEAALQAPAEVDKAAQAEGMVRQAPAGYMPAPPGTASLQAPIDAAPPPSPWQVVGELVARVLWVATAPPNSQA
jgi:hypothetical protein